MRKIVMALTLLSGAALADGVDAENCIIQEVLPGKHMTGAFVTFDNETDHPVILEKAEIASVSDHVELHEMAHENGVMKMQEIKQYELPPGETAFEKGGYHVMIMDIENIPEIGSEHEMTFTFESGETVSCEAQVLSVDEVMEHFKDQNGDMKHDHSDMHHHDHDSTDKGGHKHNS